MMRISKEKNMMKAIIVNQVRYVIESVTRDYDEKTTTIKFFSVGKRGGGEIEEVILDCCLQSAEYELCKHIQLEY